MGGANVVNGVIKITEQIEITDADSWVLPTRVERSGLVKLTWRFSTLIYETATSFRSAWNCHRGEPRLSSLAANAIQ